MARKIKIAVVAVLILFFLGGAFIQAQAESSTAQPLSEVYIKYQRVGWQMYEFVVQTNLDQIFDLQYEWRIDNKETFNAETLRYFFERGEHVVKVKVEDKYGNVVYDTVRININFWSLKNNWFWWLLYLIIILIIIYYWIVKIVYLLNRRKISKEVRFFMDVLDEHGWVEKLVAEHLKKVKSEKVKGKSIKKSKIESNKQTAKQRKTSR